MTVTIVTTIIVLGVLIFVHELGHFLVAKRAGVGVLKFSLGFGPKVVGVKRGETEYLISALPLGGYVKMIGEDPTDESPEAGDLRRSFSRRSVGTRALIVLAGPVANIILPILIFWGLFTFVGQSDFPTVIGSPAPGSPAAAVRLETGDRIVAVNGKPVERWGQVMDATEDAAGQPVRLTVQRDGAPVEVELQPRPKTFRDVLGRERQVWDLGVQPRVASRIGGVELGNVAEAAGLRAGDRIVAVGGTPVEEWEQMARSIRASLGKALVLRVERDGRQLDVEVVPRPALGSPEMGAIGISQVDETQFHPMNPASALGVAVTRTFDLAGDILTGVVRLVQGHIPANTIGGVILIGQMTGQVAQRGLLHLVTFTAMLSINLAILNLLPVPVLDGGHLAFAFIEWLRGKPVSLRKREIAQQVGLVLLVALMVFATYNDVFRLFGWVPRP
jgi:regulator of sigma E protease